MDGAGFVGGFASSSLLPTIHFLVLPPAAYFPARPPDGTAAFVGELSLSGALRPITGMLPMALAAVKAGITELYVPADSRNRNF